MPAAVGPPRTDANWRVRLVAPRDREADTIRQLDPADPKLSHGELVRVEGMTAQAWTTDGRSAMTLRANAIRAVNPRTQVRRAAA